MAGRRVLVQTLREMTRPNDTGPTGTGTRAADPRLRPRSRPRPRAASPSAGTWGLLVLLGVIWGGAFFLARVAVAEIPPLLLVACRVVLAGAVLHLVLLATRRTLWPHRHRWRDFLALGLLNNAVPFSLLFVGQTELGAGLASILNATTPIWTVLIAHVLTSDERMDPGKLAGVLLGFAGVAVMLGPAALAGRAEASAPPLWAMACVVGGAASYALASIFAKRFVGVPPLATATGQLTASSAVMIPVALLAHGLPEWSAVSPATWGAVTVLSVVSTAFAYILFFEVLRRAGAVNVSLVTLLVPPSAILLGWLILGERLGANAWLGLALIACGLLVLDGRLGARLRRRREGG